MGYNWLMIKTYLEGEEFLFLGEKYKLKFGNFKTILVLDGYLYFPQFLTFRIQKELRLWYLQQASLYIEKRVRYYSQRMKVNYVNVSIADTKSRWGACSHDNRLQFNWRLIMTPHAVLDSVVVHELAHTVVKNHSNAFWLQVRKIMPGYSANRSWINHHQNELVI